MSRTHFSLVGLAAFALAIPTFTALPQAQAASFDCRKAGLTADETAICQNIALNDMDVRMVTTFELLREILPMGGRGALETAQIEWLNKRRACEADLDCLAAAYASRMAELRSGIGDVIKMTEMQGQPAQSN
ncbi:MAG: lysozyme inhibitor LprI family protein [Rhizobium sp.]|nr:lysozyme inhibitor LprI family protein [Rhizobium sp.]